MELEPETGSALAGERVGYILGYVLFTAILFLLLKLTDRLPDRWGIVYVVATTAAVTLIGLGIRRYLR